MWERPDSQEVGLEAATLQRKRNSSLVERARAENITGLSHAPKLRDGHRPSVGEHCILLRSRTVRSGGAYTRADVGMSSDKEGEKPSRRKPKGSWVKIICSGLVGS